MKYSKYDLGFGLHIVSDEVEDYMIPNLAVVQLSLGKLYPTAEDSDVWESNWSLCHQLADSLIFDLNSGSITEEQASEEIKRLNKFING